MQPHQLEICIARAATWLAAAVLSMLLAPAATAAETASLPEPTDGHRVLRDNAPAGFVAPTEPSVFEGFPDTPAFSVVSRQGELRFYPCANCHAQLPVNPEPRRLMAPHPAALNHGDGRFWCLDCHAAENRNVLETLAGEQAGFDDSYLVCGQCHYAPQKDWYFGAHGKRVANWQGERKIYNCTHCHDPHDPSVKARAPEPPPPVRRGLAAMPMHQHGGDADDEAMEVGE